MTRFHVKGLYWFRGWRYIVLDRRGDLVPGRHDWIEALAHAIQRNDAWRRRCKAEVRRLERGAV